MKFSLVTLHVQDIDKAVEFYHNLLEMPIIRRQPIGPGKELIFLGTEGNVSLELVPAEEKVVYSGFSIGFDVENLEAVKESLAAAGYPVEREISPNPSLKLAFLTGPCGEEVELVAYN